MSYILTSIGVIVAVIALAAISFYAGYRFRKDME